MSLKTHDSVLLYVECRIGNRIMQYIKTERARERARDGEGGSISRKGRGRQTMSRKGREIEKTIFLS